MSASENRQSFNLAKVSHYMVLVYMKFLCLCKKNVKSDVVEATERFVGIQFFKYNVHTINIAVHRETCTEITLSSLYLHH